MKKGKLIFHKPPIEMRLEGSPIKWEHFGGTGCMIKLKGPDGEIIEAHILKLRRWKIPLRCKMGFHAHKLVSNFERDEEDRLWVGTLCWPCLQYKRIGLAYDPLKKDEVKNA